MSYNQKGCVEAQGTIVPHPEKQVYAVCGLRNDIASDAIAAIPTTIAIPIAVVFTRLALSEDNTLNKSVSNGRALIP